MGSIIPGIIKKASPALVSVIMLKSAQTRNGLDDEYGAQSLVELETGSGFFVDKNGLVVTNWHVVYEAGYEYLISWQGGKYPAKVISRSPFSDIAILQAEVKNVPYIKLGDSSKLELGETVIALGNVLGELQNTVSVGIVSGLSRNIYAVDEAHDKTFELRGMIQTDAAINPGNSGGPLLNSRAEAIGVNTATITAYENIGFAIPIQRVKLDIEEVKRFGRIRRPQLGVRYIILDRFLARKYGLEVEYGAYILKEPEPDGQGVIRNSPADKAGINEGDIVVSCDGEDITNARTLRDILLSKEIGRKLKLRVLRGAGYFDTEIVLEEER